MKNIESLEDFMREYFPEEYSSDLESRMTPTELGNKWASEILAKIKPVLLDS
jgi:hypothetical protein